MSCESRGVCICHDPHPVEVRDNLEKLPLFFYHGGLGIELKSQGLAANVFSH